MSRTACARSAAISGLGSPTAHTSMSAAMPSAWPGTSKAPWSRSSPPTARVRPTRRSPLSPACRNPGAISRTCIDAARRAQSRSLAACPAHGAARAAADLPGARRQTGGGCRPRPDLAWKAELLSAAGADVVVFAQCPCEELHALAAQPPRGAIVLQHRAWQAEDFCGAAVAVAGFDDDRDAQRFAEAARAAGVLVNVIDKPAY